MTVLIVSLFFALVIAIFALQNAAPVLVQFFWVTKEVPLVLVILASALAGALIVFLLALWREFRYKHKKASQEKKAKEADLKESLKPEEKTENKDTKQADKYVVLEEDQYQETINIDKANKDKDKDKDNANGNEKEEKSQV